MQIRVCFLVSGPPEERKNHVADIYTAEKSKIVFCSAQYQEDVKTTFKYFIENG